MAKLFDWKTTDDPRDVIHMAVQAVAEGHIVAVPGDCSYLMVGSGLHESTVERLAGCVTDSATSHGLTLMLRSAAELRDYFPDAAPQIHRLATKIWPGPVAMELRNSHENSLFNCMPGSAAAALHQPNSKVRVSLPSHPIFQQMSRLLVGPLVAVPAPGPDGNPTRFVEMFTATSACEPCTMIIDDGETLENGLPTLVEFENNLATIAREGIVAKEYLEGLSRITFLFVCTGNTCRSPMAQALMNKKIEERFSKHFPDGNIPIVAYSAGVAAYGGDPASPGACQAIQPFGTNLANHASCQLSLEMAEQADLILTMGNRHRHVIASQWPSVTGKIQLISPEGAEISDPFGGPLEAYEKCIAQLDKHTDYWIEQIKLSEIIRWNDKPSTEGP